MGTKHGSFGHHSKEITDSEYEVRVVCRGSPRLRDRLGPIVRNCYRASGTLTFRRPSDLELLSPNPLLNALIRFLSLSSSAHGVKAPVTPGSVDAVHSCCHGPPTLTAKDISQRPTLRGLFIIVPSN